MLHVVSVHFASPRWIEIQGRHLRRHLSVPYMTWTSLEGIDPYWGEHFDRVFEQRGEHPGKLNHLAMEIAHEFPPEDLIMFLDGDAFPIADPMPLIERSLAQSALLAVRRAENVDQPQPHPCFCATTVGAWLELPGDWSGGPTWPGARGIRVTDVGGMLLRTMQLKGLDWTQVLRTNKVDLDPLHFAVYGDVVYHHGAGFRTGQLSGAHSHGGPERVHIPGGGPLNRLINRRRWVRWERGMQAHHLEQSEQVYETIAAGGDEWLGQFI